MDEHKKQPHSISYYSQKLQALPNYNLRKVLTPTFKQIRQSKKIFIVAICGKAMGSLAQLLIELGYSVSGSDSTFYPPMSDLLKKLGIKTYEGFNEENLRIQKPDIVVVGNSISDPKNVETAYARQNKIPQMSVVEALSEFVFKDRKVLVVAGTHGKTTTTGLLFHVLNGCGLDPGLLVGGVDRITNKASLLGKGQYFVIEGDEYGTSYFDKSPKFLKYQAFSAIITSIQLDHINFFPDFEDYQQAFKFFVQTLPKEGYLIACGDFDDVISISQETKAQLSFYGVRPQENGKLNFRAQNVRTEMDRQIAEIFFDETLIGTMKTRLFGKYNLQNCLSVFALAFKLGCNPQQIIAHIETFQGMKQRQDLVYNGLLLGKKIDVFIDFAHHQTAVLQTLKGFRQRFPDRKLVALYEFSTMSGKRKQFEHQYENSFDPADLLILKSIPQTTETLNPQKIKQKFNERKGREMGIVLDSVSQIVVNLVQRIEDGWVIIIMTSKTFDGLSQLLIKEIERLNSQ